MCAAARWMYHSGRRVERSPEVMSSGMLRSSSAGPRQEPQSEVKAITCRVRLVREGGKASR